MNYEYNLTIKTKNIEHIKNVLNSNGFIVNKSETHGLIGMLFGNFVSVEHTVIITSPNNDKAFENLILLIKLVRKYGYNNYNITAEMGEIKCQMKKN